MHQCHVKCAFMIPPWLCCTVIIVFPFIFVPSGRLHLTVWLLASVCLSILISSIISALLPRIREVGESLLYRPISSALTLTAAALLTFWCVLLESLCASGNDMPMASCFSLYYYFFDFYSSLTCCRALYEEIESWVHFFNDQLFSMQVIAIDEKRTRTQVISGGYGGRKREGAREFMVHREKKTDCIAVDRNPVNHNPKICSGLNSREKQC